MVNPNKYDENYFKNLIRLVCVIKPIIAWHSNTTGNLNLIKEIYVEKDAVVKAIFLLID